MDELEAIQRCQRGDMDGLEPLIERYQARAQRLAYLLTGDHALAEDITQDSFIQAFRRMRQFDATRPLAPWLHRIVTNTARERLRSRRRLREVPLESALAPEGPSASAAPANLALRLEQAEERQAMLAALDALTQKQREAVILRYYLGYGDHEGAAIAGCREGAFRVRLHDGLRALKQVIREQYPWLSPVGAATDDDAWEDVRHVAL